MGKLESDPHDSYNRIKALIHDVPAWPSEWEIGGQLLGLSTPLTTWGKAARRRARLSNECQSFKPKE